jgi:predicted  nucleic acid-binding Zn-ribbon protein
MAKHVNEREKKVLNERFYPAVIAALQDFCLANNNEPRFSQVPKEKPADAKEGWKAPRIDATYEQMIAKPEKAKAAPKAKKSDIEPTAEQKAAAEAAAKAEKEARAAEKKKKADEAPAKWFTMGSDLAQQLDALFRKIHIEFDGLDLDAADTAQTIVAKLRERWDAETMLASFLELGYNTAPRFGELLKAQVDENLYFIGCISSMLPKLAGSMSILAIIATAYYTSIKALAYHSAASIYLRITSRIDGDILVLPLMGAGLTPDQTHEILTSVRPKVAKAKPADAATAK